MSCDAPDNETQNLIASLTNLANDYQLYGESVTDFDGLCFPIYGEGAVSKHYGEKSGNPNYHNDESIAMLKEQNYSFAIRQRNNGGNVLVTEATINPLFPRGSVVSALSPSSREGYALATVNCTVFGANV